MDYTNISSITINDGHLTNIATNLDELNIYNHETSTATIEVMKRLILESIYPIDSIYMSYTDSRNPNEILGFGTWEQIKNKYIYGNSTPSEGGNDYINIDMLPSHTHKIDTSTSINGDHSHTLTSEGYHQIKDKGDSRHFPDTGGRGSTIQGVTSWVIKENGTHNHTFTGQTELSTPQNMKNLPKYCSFYIWHRTA